MDKLQLGWVIGKKYRIWTGDIDLVLGYESNGAVRVLDTKTGQIRTHLTSVWSSDRVVD